jgi:hypothetical protein
MECLDVCSLTRIHLTVTAPSYFLNTFLNLEEKKAFGAPLSVRLLTMSCFATGLVHETRVHLNSLSSIPDEEQKNTFSCIPCVKVLIKIAHPLHLHY